MTIDEIKQVAAALDLKQWLDKRLTQMERRLLTAIKDPSNIKLEALTAELKTGTDALDAAVKANQP